MLNRLKDLKSAGDPYHFDLGLYFQIPNKPCW